MLTYYPKAKSAGDREVRNAILLGRRKRLLSLEDIVKKPESLTQVPVGQVEIPMDAIGGTLTRMRARSFSPGYYPTLFLKSEFAKKWEGVYHYQEDRGITDPIKVYEYMRKFYVQEGNKRVSVMKYFGAVTITADVTRLLPERDGKLETEIYYEFLPFYEATGFYDIWFTARGRYEKLANLFGHPLTGTRERWPEEDLSLLRRSYGSFEESFEKYGGNRTDITAGDAYLVYLGFYTAQSIIDEDAQVLRTRIAKLWGEFRAETENNDMLYISEGELTHDGKIEEGRRGFFGGRKLHSPLDVFFLYDGDYRESGWLYGHELGRSHVEEVFGDRIRTHVKENTGWDEDLRRAIDQAVSEGADLIFTSSPAQMRETSRAAIHYPKVRFLNCSLNLPYQAVRTYYGRMYEVKFLLGMIAAQMADDHRIGYLANYPIYGAIADINAFAEGASMIDPRIRIYLRWTTLREPDAEIEEEMKSIRVISGHDLIKPSRQSREYGVFLRVKKSAAEALGQSKSSGKTQEAGQNGSSSKTEELYEIQNLAAPIWNWGKYYEMIISSVLNGSYDRDSRGMNGEARNYWLGLPSGVVDILLSQKMPLSTRRLVETFRQMMQEDNFHPFEKEVRVDHLAKESFALDKSAGKANNDENSAKIHKIPLDKREIITMNSLHQNVVGRIPVSWELTEHALPTTKVSGVIR